MTPDRISPQAIELIKNRRSQNDFSLSSQTLSETVFQPLPNQPAQLFWLLDADGRVLGANQTALTFGHVDLSQALKTLVYKTWRFSQGEQVRLKAAIASAAHGCTVCYDAIVQDESDRSVTLNVVLRETAQDIGELVLIMMKGAKSCDRPQLEMQIEAQRLHNQRLQSIGNMTIGLAHDLCNLLTPLVGSAHLLRLEFPEADRQQRELFRIIETISNRANKLVKQMLSFTKGDAKQQSAVEIDYLILEVETLMKATFPASISIETDLSPRLWSLYGNENQLYQVLINLCLNARDAMPNGGVLKLSAENIYVDQIEAGAASESASTNYVAIQVSDTGAGIPASILDSIFVPFFTTKTAEEGTGVGLSTVRDIVKNHGGFVDVSGEVNPLSRPGTRFSVYLPASM